MKNRTALSKLLAMLVVVIVLTFSIVPTAIAQTNKKITTAHAAQAASRREQPRSDEILLTRIATGFYSEYDPESNTSILIPDELMSIPKNLQRIGFKEKRLGTIYYGKYGDILNEDVPVFVKKKEYKAYMQKLKPNSKSIQKLDLHSI
jgi:hypothetical protein